jgi:hypothetical protein
MATDTTVNNLIINKLTKAQYDAIASHSDTELYLVPDEIDDVPTSGSDNPVKSGGVYTALGNKQDTLVSGSNIKTINNESILGSGNITIQGGGTAGIPIVNHGTDDTTFSVTPNTLHIWGEVAALTLTLATPTDATIVNEYMIQFTSGSTATTLSLPASLTWYGSAPSIEADKTYQISIINNVGIWGGA